jgi:hypothetical protein
LRKLPPIIVELPSDELGGASGARLFHVLAVGKANTAKYPYTVANEKIATEIGRAIGLRIPEVLLNRVTGEWHAFSTFIERTESGEGIPEGTAKQIQQYYEENPSELHGMVCFDLFVGNNDRKTDNLILGQDGIVRLIDHANALFYRHTDTVRAGIERLESIERDLSAMFDRKHWFLSALTSWEYVDEWCDRIAKLPTYFLKSIINNLPSEVLSSSERAAVLQFLERRKQVLGRVIRDNLSLFPGLPGVEGGAE